MNNDCNCNENANSSKEELLKEIQECTFYVIELALYLDINPEDERALLLHNQHANMLRKLTDKYESMYGPLSINCPCNKWRWLEEPWPWEKGGSN